MKCVGKKSLRCGACKEWKYNAPFYDWYSMITKEFLATICHKCCVREMFGSNYKKNKRYLTWIKKIKEDWK